MFGFFKRRAPQAEPAPVSPVPVSPKPAPVLAAPPPTLTTSDGAIIAVPFSDILARLSGALAPLPSASITGNFPLPVNIALAQLPAGVVRVRFAQIRQAAAPGSFNADTALDETLIELPLAKIIAAMSPALLARRPEQKKVEVPAEIAGVFGPKEKSTFAAPVIAPTPAPAPAPMPVAPPMPIPMPSVPIPMPSADRLTIKLSAVYESWPETIRLEITQAGWNDASAALPLSRLEAAIKTGRVVFSWREVRQWLDVSTASVPSLHQETNVELPLRVLAPLFMSRRQTSVNQTKTVVAENIPNVFAIPGKSPAPAQPEPAPIPAPVQAVVPAPAPVPAAAPAPASALGEMLGQPAKKDWSPQEITQRINALPGVASSIIAMSDGLLVAGALPSPLKSDTMAAFLPQLFGRMTHYSNEVQLGPLHSLTLQAGPVACAIFKTGTTYLAVLGKAGESLPDAPLQRLAAELTKRSQ